MEDPMFYFFLHFMIRKNLKLWNKRMVMVLAIDLVKCFLGVLKNNEECY